MLEQRKGSRIKTEGDRLVQELHRQKSLFKNLSWQDKQKDRKISFLQRYYVQLQAVIQKEKQEDSALLKRAHGHTNKRKLGYAYKSNILGRLDLLGPKRRFVTQGYEDKGNSAINSESLVSLSLRKSHIQK